MDCHETRASSAVIDVHVGTGPWGHAELHTGSNPAAAATHGTLLKVMLRLHIDEGAANEKKATGSFQQGFECPVATSWCRLLGSLAMLEPCIQGCA